MSWLAQYFLHPAFVLPGLALAAVPILIHLLSRLRYRRIRFAAMEFLLQSDEQNRRRLILEQLLLLLLRVLAVVLIVLLISRLVIDPSGLLLLRGATAHHVLILDDTLSMRDQSGSVPAFERAVAVLERLLSTGTWHPRSVRITILTTTSPDRPLVTDRELDGALLQELIPRLKNLRCSWKAASPVPALNAAAGILSADSGITPAVHVITDLRHSDWIDRPDVIQALADLEAVNAGVHLIRVAAEPGDNAAVMRLHSDTSSAAAGVPWRLSATVRNLSEKRMTDLAARITIDGQEQPGRVRIGDLEAGGSQVVYHDLTFRSPGRHLVSLHLDDDCLAADNVRSLTVHAAAERRVLVVDDRGLQEDAGFVTAALSAEPRLTGIVSDVRTSEALTSEPLERFDCIYLLNIRELPADAVQQLIRYVRSGGGVAWFPDEQAATDWYNTALQQTDRELFPVTLGVIQEISVPDDPSAEPPFAHPVFEDHPVFEVYTAPDSPFADLTRFEKWFRPADEHEPRPGVRVLGRLTTGDPLVLEHRLGRGRILTFLTSAGRRWSNWPVPPAAPAYVVMHLRLHAYLQRPDDSVGRLEIGEPLSMQWSLRDYTNLVELLLPADQDAATAEDSDEGLVRLEARPVPPDGDRAADDVLGFTTERIDRPGLLRVRRFTENGNAEETWLAVNVPVTESDLAPADPAVLLRSPELKDVRVVEGDTVSALRTADFGRELRWVLLGSLVAVLICEQLLSLRLSFHPEGRG